MSTDEMLMLADMMEKTAVFGRGFRVMRRAGRASRRAAQEAAGQGGTVSDQVRAIRAVLSKRMDSTSARDALSVAGALGTIGLAGYGGKKLLFDDSSEAPQGSSVPRRY